MSLVKSKQRVADHGEVFTPAWMVEAMLDLVKDETERIPMQTWDRTWTDAELYEKYGITKDEQSNIESQVRPMNLQVAADE
jgi:hypothetical protein